jgi:Tfp pilus assembly protein FimT
MFSRIFGFIMLLAMLYILAIFALPEFADTYGDRDINTKIRNLKNQSLEFASGSNTPESLWKKIHTTISPQIQELQSTVQEVTTTVDTKIQQAQEASQAVQSAYSGVLDAKQKIQNLGK